MATIYDDLRDQFLNPQYSDLEVICRGGSKLKVHRMVIAFHSPILDSMVTESRDNDGQIVSRIELQDVDFTIVYMMLQFFYGGNYNDYERVGSFHSPSYVVFMTPQEVVAGLETLPCLQNASTTEDTSVDGEYDDQEWDGQDDEDGEDDDEEISEGSSSSGSSQGEVRQEGKDRDGKRYRVFNGHNLFDSLQVYRVASRFNVLPLKLLARDRFYRTAEKVLQFSQPRKREGKWWTHDDQRIYRSKLAEAIYKDFPHVVRELYDTIPESDTVIRAIPPMLIAAGYNDDAFRDHTKPLLEDYPGLALAVTECMRIPYSKE
ncbi:hypothetical protein SAMD00023353_3800180 [Rosellinia necatrix]|uniref:BTB domain-containing protein n=1 Tax=Rosellinia necatrix TaxID=77044 RepID=A0A1W2TMD8_ROSNE|nr:hypothetical protein SAMD00023353_3800180 [Rosellinia necatrix]